MKNTIRYLFIPTGMAIVFLMKNIKYWQGYGEIGTLYTVGGNINWFSDYGKQYGGSSKKLKIELPYDSAIPLLGVNPKNKKQRTKHWNLKDICTPMFVAALFTIAEIWKQRKYPSTDEWIKNE